MKHISSTHQQRRKAFTGKHKRRRRRAKGSRFGKGTSGGSGSTGREAIEEKERKMKRWRGIESISFRLNKRRNGAWVCCVWVAWRREVARQGRNGETKGAFGLTKEW
jgi:hypothetical protein